MARDVLLKNFEQISVYYFGPIVGDSFFKAFVKSEQMTAAAARREADGSHAFQAGYGSAWAQPLRRTRQVLVECGLHIRRHNIGILRIGINPLGLSGLWLVAISAAQLNNRPVGAAAN